MHRLRTQPRVQMWHWLLGAVLLIYFLASRLSY